MKNKIFTINRPSSLVCIWRSAGDSGKPLVCSWVQVEAAKLRPESSGSSNEEPGGLRLCA